MIDLEGKSAIVHAIGGVLFGLLANYIYSAGLGMASGMATLLFLFIGLIIMGHISAMIFGRNSLSQKQWLGTGGTSYFFTAIVFWIISFNGVVGI